MLLLSYNLHTEGASPNHRFVFIYVIVKQTPRPKERVQRVNNNKRPFDAVMIGKRQCGNMKIGMHSMGMSVCAYVSVYVRVAANGRYNERKRTIFMLTSK